MDYYNTTNLPDNLADESFAANIMRIAPNGSAPLFALTGLAKQKSIQAISHMWWTKKARFPVITLSADASDSATTLSITDVTTEDDGNLDYIKKSSVIRIEDYSGASMKFEHIYVTDVDRAANTIDVVRGFGGTTPMALTTSHLLVKIGTAFGQGSNAPDPTTMPVSDYSNYTQIFRNSWGIARTLDQIKLRGGLGVGLSGENKDDAMFFHANDIEKTLIFGKKGTATDLEGNPMTLCGGIEQQIFDMAPGNLVTADSAGTSFDQLEGYLDPLLDNMVEGSNGVRMHDIYCGKQALSVFNQIGKNYAECQVTMDQTSFGQRFRRFDTNRGSFRLIEHPQFNTNANWAKMALVLDTSMFDVMYLQKTMHEDIEQVGRDSSGGVFTTELTAVMKNAFSSGIIYNLTQASAG